MKDKLHKTLGAVSSVVVICGLKKYLLKTCNVPGPTQHTGVDLPMKNVNKILALLSYSEV